MKLWVMRRLTALTLKYKWYYRWSRAYQYMFEHSFRKMDPKKHLPEFQSMDKLSRVLSEMRWRPDKWWMLWDAISHPCATFDRYQLGKTKPGDCDDISLVAACAIEDMRDRNVLSNVRDVGLLSIPWIDAKGKIGGHNVCAFSFRVEVFNSSPEIGETEAVQWGHISNWYAGLPSTGLKSLKDVVRNVLGDERESLGWAYVSSDLRTLYCYGPGGKL